MNEYGITKENLMGALPPALRGDPSVVALAEALATVLADRLPEIDRLLIYPAIDTLDESLLDILAHDFKVDWWDPEYSLEEKRRTLKDSWRVHKLLGTKAAVETAIRAIYPLTTVEEWFEYGGEPYHFRLDINITDDSINSVKQRRVLERLNFYKSLRSHNDGVTYFVRAQPAQTNAEACIPGMWETVHTGLILPVSTPHPTAGVRVKASAGLLETAVTRMDLPIPIQAAACVGIATVLREEYTAQFELPDVKPPVGGVKLWAAAGSKWQECYVTQAIPLMDEVLTATAQAHAKGVVASTQETAKTQINL